VVSGGPGTGKTFMVAKMLSNHLMHTKEKALRIVLCAPTGKAGVRLQEAVKEAKSYFKEIPDNIKKAIPDESFTIHRLLRPVPDTPYFRHNADNPLPYDVVVVDEASMVDLALMTKLMDALVPHARIIFLGDKDQLSSVEAGYVLGDICNAGRPGSVSPVSDCIVQLRKNYRQQADDYIHDAGRAVNQGDGSQAISILKSRGMFLHLPSRLHMLAYIKKRIKPWLDSFSGCTDFKAAYDNYNNFRILCPIHAGPFGLRDINEIISRIVCQEADIRPLQPWYHGLPIMVLRNDYTTGLFNGDTGIIMQAPDDKNRLMACFQGLEDDPKRFLPARLPESETAYAMTVHKSQGSEFDEVLIILPEQDVPVLTRELVYTAITRAKKKVEIIGNEEVFKKAVSRRIERSSGLRDALWG
jgi:exodeoxyribonuclease V alpha subunit